MDGFIPEVVKEAPRKELIYQGWTVGYTAGTRAYLNEDAPSSFIDRLLDDGYAVVRV